MTDARLNPVLRKYDRGLDYWESILVKNKIRNRFKKIYNERYRLGGVSAVHTVFSVTVPISDKFYSAG